MQRLFLSQFKEKSFLGKNRAQVGAEVLRSTRTYRASNGAAFMAVENRDIALTTPKNNGRNVLPCFLATNAAAKFFGFPVAILAPHQLARFIPRG